jgi:hypothetical protein
MIVPGSSTCNPGTCSAAEKQPHEPRLMRALRIHEAAADEAAA